KSSVISGPVPKPWLKHPTWCDKATWWVTFVPSFLGLMASIITCYIGYRNVALITQPLCLVMEDNFETFNVDTVGSIWQRDVEMGGFGQSTFEMTTASSNNAFVKGGMLYLMPTLTELSIPGGNDSVFDGYTYNISGCTNTMNVAGMACGAVSNRTSNTIISPVMSARITTQQSHNIQYGKVEVRSKLPIGDWLWPGIRMLPVNDTYGSWPISGKIIMESRGNDVSYRAGGSNSVQGSLNWGPIPGSILNAVYKTANYWSNRRVSFSQGFHTYTLEWTPEFLRISVDSRLKHLLDLRFNVPFFQRGNFPVIIQNNTRTIILENPWEGRGNSAPFDQPFYLAIDLAVGGTTGWFPDNVGGKPWLDRSATAMRDFALAQPEWYKTWPEDPQNRAMIIDYVKMWQIC
ncbi:putative member of glycoside hydrolase family GH16, partial [Hysterangium stoloniferum]